MQETTISAIVQKVAEDTCSDYASEYGNDSRYTPGDGPIVVQSHDMIRWMDKHPRIERAAADQGIELVNYDEYTVDHENGKVWRTQPDSYGWTPSVVWSDGGDLITPDDDIEEWIEFAKNEPDRCLTDNMVLLEALEDAGFHFIPDDDTVYESGRHPGQTDDPTKLMAKVRETHPNSEIICWLKESSQFYVKFQLMYRGNRVTVSNNHWSHDLQVQDALSYISKTDVLYYERLVRSNPELLRLEWSGPWVDTEAMGLDDDFMSWVATEIEDNTSVFWEDGEPYAIEI